MLRIFLFLATNAVVLVPVSTVFRQFGIGVQWQENGVDRNLNALSIMSAVIGFGGSFISLPLS
jgi:heat shock protein HtpX